MRFLIDNALSPSIAKGLVEAGYCAIHVRELGLEASKDKIIMEKAFVDNMIIVSADTDFGTLLALNDSTKPSFILFRRTNKKPSALLKLLLSLIETIKNDLEMGAVVVIEDKRVRVRKLPVTKNK